MIYHKKRAGLRDQNEHASGLGQREALYGLPGEVKFCSRCVISNQRPNSAVEFQHTASSKKETIRFDNIDVCDAC